MVAGVHLSPNGFLRPALTTARQGAEDCTNDSPLEAGLPWWGSLTARQRAAPRTAETPGLPAIPTSPGHAQGPPNQQKRRGRKGAYQPSVDTLPNGERERCKNERDTNRDLA